MVRQEASRDSVPAAPAVRGRVGDVASRGADAEREWLPPLFEARMLDADGVSRLLDLHQSRSVEQLREMAFANACEVGLVYEVGIELTRCIQSVLTGPRPPA